MDKYEKRRMVIEGRFILHLRMQGFDLPIRHLREMEKRYGTLARLKGARVVTVSELCSLDYMRLKEIVGTERADFILHLLGLYDLKTAPNVIIAADAITIDAPH